METKVCKKCLDELPVKQFYVQTQRSNVDPTIAWKHYDSMCKKCRLKGSAQRKRDLKIRAVAYKGGKCVDCGLVDDPCVYDFHHVDPSQKEIAIGSNYRSFEYLRAELDKCVLLCAHCHRKRHQREHLA